MQGNTYIAQLRHAIDIVDLLIEDTKGERREAYKIARELMVNCFNPGKNDTPETFIAAGRVN